MKWDSRGLWYWIPAVMLLVSFVVDQPLDITLKATATAAVLGITWLLRRRDRDWGRTGQKGQAPIEPAE